MLMTQRNRNTKKSKKKVRKGEILEEGELKDESFNRSADCEAQLSPFIRKDKDVLPEGYSEEGLEDQLSEEEIRRAKKRHHRRQRRKHKTSRSIDRKSRRKKRRSDSISDYNDSPPLVKRKRSERVLKVKKYKRDSFRDVDPDVRRSSGSPMITGSSLSMPEPAVSSRRLSRESPFLSRSCSLNMSQSRTSTPFPGHEARLNAVDYSTESDSCYSELEMHLKQRHDPCGRSESSRSAGSKCGFLEDSEQHRLPLEPPHSSFRKSAPPKDVFIRNEIEEPPHPLELIEGRFRRHPDFPEQRREFYSPRFYEEFHPPRERFDSHHLHHHRHPPMPDCSCRRHNHHHLHPEMFHHRGDRRFVVSRDLEDEQRQNMMQIRGSDPLRKRRSSPGPMPKAAPDKPEAVSTVTETNKKVSVSRESPIDDPPVEATSKNPSPPLQETAFKPISAFQQKLEQQLAGDRNPQEGGRPPPYNMPLPPPFPPLGNALLPIQDSQMIRPHPMANFPPPARMILSGQRPPPLVHLPPSQGPMPPMLPPVVRSLPPPPWLPPQRMFLKQPSDANPIRPSLQPANPSSSAPTGPDLGHKSSINNTESVESCNKAEDNKMGASQPTCATCDKTSDREDNGSGKEEDIISLDDPDVINVSSDTKNAELSMDHQPSQETSRSSVSLLKELKTSEISINKSDESWSYSSDEDLRTLQNLQEKSSTASVSSPVQSIFDIISKKKKIGSSSVDSNLLSKVANVINLSPVNEEPMTYLNRSGIPAHETGLASSDVTSPSNSSSMASSFLVNSQKGSGSAGSSIRLILKSKKSTEGICELRKEPVNIPLDVNSNLHDSTSCADPRKTQDSSDNKELTIFVASVPAFGCKAASASGRTKALAQNASSKLQIVADIGKKDPRMFRGAEKHDKTENGESVSQVFTPKALLTRPTVSLQDCLPDLNIDLSDIEEGETKQSESKRINQELPKLPKLVKANSLNCLKAANSENDNNVEHFRKTSGRDSPDTRAIILPEKDTEKCSMTEIFCKKTNTGHLPRLIPAPLYAARLREAQLRATQTSNGNH